MFNRFIIYFVRRYWFFVALGATVVIVFFLWVTTPQPPAPTPTPTSRPITPIGGERIAGTFRLDSGITLPTTQAALYRLEKTSFSPTKAVAIAQALGFSGNPRISQDVDLGELYTWSQPGQSILISLDAAAVSYGRELFLTPPPRTGPLPSPEAAQKALLDILEGAGLLPENIILEPQAPNYLTFDGVQFLGATPEEAAFVHVSFLPKVSEGSVALATSVLAPIRGMATFGGIIQSFDYELPFSNLEPTEQVLLKDKNQVQSSLFLEGRIITLESGYEGFDLDKVSEAVLTQAELVYPLASPPQEILSPVFLLTGTATTREGESRQIQVYLPAVAP